VPADKPNNKIEPAGFTPLSQAQPAPPRGARLGRFTLGLGLLAIAAVLAFVFSARSVLVTVDSETPATLSIKGLAVPFGERFLVRPGEYRVEAHAEGYRPLSTTITVDERNSQSVVLGMQPLPGRLTIFSEPPGAAVAINGEPAGATPLDDLAVASGEHTVVLQHPRYFPAERAVRITGRGVRQQLDLALEPAWAEVSVSSTPPGARIIVDGEALGTTPGSVEVVQGTRQLELALEGFQRASRELRVIAGEPQDLGNIALRAAGGMLSLETEPGGASVVLDGEFRGHTPLALELEPGREHKLDVFKPGYQRFNDTVALESTRDGSRRITLQPLLGEVRFNLSPADALLSIDGRPVGKGSRTLSLTAVPHNVEVSLAGHATVRREVTPRPGLPQQLNVSLLTQKQARLASIPQAITSAAGQTLLLFNPADSRLPEFSLGASRREPGRRANEILRPVALRRMFYLQTTEVTNGEFRQYDASHDSGRAGGKSLNSDRQPAVQVSWQQAAAFCNWLSRRDGLPPFYREDQGIIVGFDASATGYRLPTEAEWAWAARSSGGELLTFPWQGPFPPTVRVENYADSKSAFITGRVLDNYDDGHVVTAAVGSFGPNQNGLYDMGGNVAEWVHDVYGIASPDSPRQTDPLGPQQGDNHVIRGASWTQSRLAELRLSYRDYGQARRDDVGFRVARYAE
jgi:formylglycine-generating enzyme required for sulfatase activity